MKTVEMILARFNALSPKLQAAARFVVDHPTDVVLASMRTVAERAQEHPATLTRLAQQLGYAGWPELKQAIAVDLGLHVEGYGQRAKTVIKRGQKQNLLTEIFAVQRQNLATTETQCMPSLKQAAQFLRTASAVHVAGFRASFPIAFSLVYGYRLFRNSVHLVDAQGGGLEMQLRAINAQDVLVVISFAPYSKDALGAIAAAKAVGARIIALTDSVASPLALAADVAVLFAVNSPSFFPSVAAGVAVSEALLELLIADAGEAAVAPIEAAERGLFNSGAYLQAPAKRVLKKP